MKKNILLAIVALMTSVCTFAQKEYNMVITLNNGTTVTLGHNDIKEITFNDGEISISGNMVNTIDSLAGVTVEQGYSIENLENENKVIVSYLDRETGELEERLDKHEMWMLNMEEGITSLLFAEIENLNRHISDLSDIIFKTIEELHPESADNPEINKVKAALASAREAADSARKTAVKQDKK